MKATLPFFQPGDAATRAALHQPHENMGLWSLESLQAGVDCFHHGDAKIAVVSPELYDDDRLSLELDHRWNLQGPDNKRVPGVVLVRCIYCHSYELVVWNHKGYNTQFKQNMR